MKKDEITQTDVIKVNIICVIIYSEELLRHWTSRGRSPADRTSFVPLFFNKLTIHTPEKTDQRNDCGTKDDYNSQSDKEHLML